MRTIALLALLSVGSAGAVAAQSIHQLSQPAEAAVATAHPLATFAAQRVLESGGNAADAAVAAAFSVAVVLPSMNSIGGRNQILVRSPDGSVGAIDGTTQIPRAYDPAKARRADSGYETVGIPGAVAGLMRLHEQYGSLPLTAVMSYAIEYAENGFRLMPQEEWFQSMAAADLAQTEGAAMYFLHPNGEPYRAGELLVQHDLAATLRQIASDNGESFYRGTIARRMAEDILSHGGYVGVEDLAEYEALDARVVRGSYRGYELVAPGVPAAGAVSIQALQVLETFERADYAPEIWAAMEGEAIALASRELRGLGSDSAAVRATSKEWARSQARRMRTAGAQGGDESAGGSSGEGGRSSWESSEPHFTTHISVADRDGMVVSLTQTVGPVMGARVATPGLGVNYAVTLGGYLGEAGPGARARSFISPLIVLKDGVPVLVLGAAGGARIVASVVQVVSRVLDDGLPLMEAMTAPRVFMGFNGAVEMETSGPTPWTSEQMERVRSLGLEVVESGGPVSFALVQALWRNPDTRLWQAASEPDGEGAAAGVGRF